MKDCGMIKDLIPLYIDGVCSEESRQLVEEHMKECDTCRMLATKMKSELTLPMEDGTKVRSFRRFFQKKVWSRVAVIVIIFVLLWLAGNWVVTGKWSEVWPKMTAEGIEEAVSVVEIDGALYLHQEDLTGAGQIVNISTAEEMDAGILKFYLGEQGLTSLDPFGNARQWLGNEAYQSLGGSREGVSVKQNEEEEGMWMTIKKVVYCHKDGTEVAVLWENGQDILELKVAE